VSEVQDIGEGIASNGSEGQSDIGDEDQTFVNVWSPASEKCTQHQRREYGHGPERNHTKSLGTDSGSKVIVTYQHIDPGNHTDRHRHARKPERGYLTISVFWFSDFPGQSLTMT
jgi:hypothetical protein